LGKRVSHPGEKKEREGRPSLIGNSENGRSEKEGKNGMEIEKKKTGGIFG